MIFRTKTSKKTADIYNDFLVRDHLQPFILAKLSISLAIRNKFHYETTKIVDSMGIDLNRQTITGDFDLLFKALIEQNEGRFIPDDEYFPNVLKAYLDHGAKLLEQEYKYANDFYIHLVELDKSI